jgi:hypothetical protein
MMAEITTTYALSAYHHLRCDSNPEGVCIVVTILNNLIVLMELDKDFIFTNFSLIFDFGIVPTVW